ncbi:hypothetical protein Rhal01_03364 [Rubritalea halochordaticola]|uniref:Prepilin-type N-terminal cleavage/methylation domain-containing protein n=1 Tax=Rubritalea halochordaticola TaxID=714537 RepID=A0ABP9V3D5_9BACT
MKTSIQFRKVVNRGVTLIELTVVICILLLLVTGSIISVNYYRNWQRGLAAGEDLKEVYSAQRMYLAEHPTVLVTDLTADLIIPYLPDGAAELPTVEGLKGEALTIDITTSPPTFMDGGVIYDPSGSPTDNLWDAGR